MRPGRWWPWRAVGYAYILTHPGMPCLFWPHAVRMPDGARIGEAQEVRHTIFMRAGYSSTDPAHSHLVIVIYVVALL